MEKQIFIIIICFICNTVSAQQNTYLDALKLKDIYDQNKLGNLDFYDVKNNFDVVLFKYELSFKNLKNNPFLNSDYLPKKKEIVNAIIKQNGKSDNGLVLETINKFEAIDIQKQNISATNWQSIILNGTKDFMAERFTAELVSMATDKAFDKIFENKEIKPLFPKSFAFIDHFKDSTAKHSLDFNILKNIVKKDIENLPNSILQTSFLNVKQKDYYSIGLSVATNVKDGYTIQQVINNLGNNHELQNSDLRNTLETLSILSNALQNQQSGSQIWINPFKELTINLQNNNEDELVARYFYGLLYEQLKNNPLFSATISNPSDFVKEIQNYGSVINQLNSTYDLAKNKDFNLKTTNDYVSYTLNLTQSVTSFLKLNNPNIDLKLLESTNSFLTIYQSILDKDYQSVVTNIYLALNNNYSLENLRAITFLSELAMIEKSEDVKNLLESYTLPIGSSSIKRKSKYNISINGYIGLTGGIERAYIDGNRDRGNFGLTAPIGFAISTSDKKRANFSAFVSIIDLGTMVNARFNDTEIENQDVKIEQFFAPGLGIYYNIQKTPISLGLHYSYIKNLKEFTQNNSIVENNFGVGRINFSVLVDIPFFNIYTH